MTEPIIGSVKMRGCCQTGKVVDKNGSFIIAFVQILGKSCVDMSKNFNSDNWGLTIISYWGMLNVGIVIGFLGPLLVPISKSFQLSLAQVGFPVVFNSMGFLLATFALASFWRVYRARRLLTFSSLFLLLSLLGISLLHTSLIVVLVLLFFVGFSAGILHTGLDSLLSEAFGRMRARYLNILHIFVSLGALAGPLLVGLILTYSEKWYLVCFLMGLLSFPLPITFWNKRLYKSATFSRTREAIDNLRQNKSVNWGFFWPIVFAIFLYVGIESSFASWTPVFLVKARDVSTAIASYKISIFWLAMIGGRWLFSRFFYKVDLSRSLIIGAAGGALSIMLSFLSKERALILWFMACSGLLFSYAYPSLLALGGNVFPNSIGFVMGILTAGGFLGSMFFPWLIGPISEAIGLTKGVFVIPLLSIGLASVLLYFHHFLAKKHQLGKC